MSLSTRLPHPSRAGRTAGLLAGGWMLASLIAGGITAMNSSCLTVPWTRLAADQSAQFGLWALLAPAIFALARRPPTSLGPFVGMQGGGLLAAVGIVGVLRPIIHNLTIHPPGERHPLGAWIGRSFVQHVHVDVLVYLGLFGLGLALVYYRRSQARDRRAAVLEAELSKSQLRTLQAQVHPHFLFNALNTVSSLADTDPVATRRFLAKLGRLLRRSLEASDADEIPLRDEMQFVRTYLDVMTLRYGPQLSTEVHLPASVTSALVPAFCLQPLVENALKHGVSTIDRPGWVRVSARRTGEALVVQVDDNGPGRGEEASGGEGGFGLDSIRARLDHLYGADATLTLNVRAGRPTDCAGGTCATLRVPYHVHTRPPVFASDR
jgi:signal transduction histidine kinase